MKKIKRMKLFKVKYSDGSRNYIVSRSGWAGLIPFANSIGVDHQEAIVIREASIFEVLRYCVKGV